MSDTKVPLVLWSGGFDSSLVVAEHLLNGQDIDVLYIELKNNASKCDREIRVIEDMMSYFNTNQEFKGRIIKNHHATIQYNGKHPCFSQPMFWTTSALGYIDVQRHSHIDISYVKGDDASVMKTEISELWAAAQRVQMQPILVPVRFPFLDQMMNKVDVLRKLSDKFLSPLYRVFELATCCEHDYPKAGCTCVPCTTHRNALKVMNFHTREVAIGTGINVYLDIDEVLNNNTRNLEIDMVQRQNQYELNLSETEFTEELCDSVVKHYENTGKAKFFRKRSKMDLGSFVNTELLDNLTQLLWKLRTTYSKVTVIGISSWFNGRNTKEISEFLGIHIEELASTVGGDGRATGVRQHLDKNPAHALILDDMTQENCDWNTPGLTQYHPYIDGCHGLDDAAIGRAIKCIDAQLNA